MKDLIKPSPSGAHPPEPPLIPAAAFFGGAGPYDNTPVANGEFIKIFFLAARESLPENVILQTIEEHGGGKYKNLDHYLKTLLPSLHVPAVYFARVSHHLAKAGMDIARVPAIGLERREHSPLYLSLLMHVVSYCMRQRLSFRPVDLVSCAFMAQRNYHHLVVNHRLVDVNLESRDGPERTARLWLVHLCPEGVYRVPCLEYGEILRRIPLPFREPPAEVEHPVTVHALIEDPHFSERLPMGIRPSLQETAQRHGFKLEARDKSVFIDGTRAAEADDDPQRVFASGIYRMTADVKKKGTGLAVERPRQPFRRSDDLVLISGHRYHFSRPLAFHDYLIKYRVSPARHLAFLPLLKVSGLVWEKLGGRPMPDPWTDVLDVIGKSPPAPAAKISGTERGDAAGEYASRSRLTSRETEILRLIVEGKTNRAIARQLTIEEATVKSHVNSILAKTGKKNRRLLIASILGAANPDKKLEW
jgi:DNA-binding CsgD family transcriptional regulator